MQKGLVVGWQIKVFFILIYFVFTADLNTSNAQNQTAPTPGTQQKSTTGKTAQTASKPPPVVTIQPKFPGGNDSLQRYLFMHINAPDSLQLRDISGTIYCSFYIEPDGETDKIKIEKGPPSPGWDSAVMICLQHMPLWIPGKVNGKPSLMRYFLPVFIPPGHQLFNMPENSK